jgi:chromosomal replication initiation ATPase DnaA
MTTRLTPKPTELTTQCPACHSTLRIDGDELAIVSVTKPTLAERWFPARHRPERAVAEVCLRSGVRLSELRSPSRKARLVRVRWKAMRAARDAGASVSEIGRLLNRDHSTVIYGLNKVEATTR